MSAHRWWPAVLAGAAIASPALAGPLTYDEALTRAQTSAPALSAADFKAEAARRSLHAAGRLPDPQLKFGVENYPVSGPKAGRFGADEMTMATVGVMQEIPNGARRRGEAAGARAEVAAAEADRRVTMREVRTSAALAWIDLYYADARLTALDAVLKELQPLWEAAPSGVAYGSTRPAAGLAPVRLRAGLLDQRDELAAAAQRAQAELTRWTGEPSPSVRGPAPAAAVSQERLRSELDRHTSLAGYAAEAQKASAAVQLAEAEKRPDWAVEVAYGRRDPMFGDMVSAGVTMRLPLFAARRQDPLIAARRADRARVDVERELAARELRARLESDLADHLMHHDQWIRTRDQVAPVARQQADLETASYAAGRAGLTEVLQAFTELAQARLMLLEREAAVARDAVRITLTYGADQP